MTTLHDIVSPWLRGDGSDELIRLRDQVEWLRRHLYEEYEPCDDRRFDERLADWLLNVERPEDRKTLFRLLGHLFFVAKPQFKALCRGAFGDIITRWLVDLRGVPLDAPDLQGRIDAAVRHTWFCPLTDSMNINAFLKVNSLQGHDIRGDWRTLETVGDEDALRRHVADKGIEQIVFLEDFVGTGDQMRSTVVWARELFPKLAMLVVPLVCCPEGAENGRLIARRFSIDFEPVLLLRDDLFVLPLAAPGEPPLFGEVRSLVEAVKDRLGDWEDEPFGHGQTGAVFAMFTNCPDNTLPIIHEESDSWRALFPRIRRE